MTSVDSLLPFFLYLLPCAYFFFVLPFLPLAPHCLLLPQSISQPDSTPQFSNSRGSPVCPQTPSLELSRILSLQPVLDREGDLIFTCRALLGIDTLFSTRALPDSQHNSVFGHHYFPLHHLSTAYPTLHGARVPHCSRAQCIGFIAAYLIRCVGLR